MRTAKAYDFYRHFEDWIMGVIPDDELRRKARELGMSPDQINGLIAWCLLEDATQDAA